MVLERLKECLIENDAVFPERALAPADVGEAQATIDNAPRSPAISPLVLPEEF
jgi:hypothetical protein